MATQTITPTPLELLEAAEREYIAGNDRESARLLAEATAPLFDMMAEAHGISLSDNYAAIARELGRKKGNEHHYIPKLGAWKDLLYHSETGVMEEYGMVEWLHDTHIKFIRDTLSELGIKP